MLWPRCRTTSFLQPRRYPDSRSTAARSSPVIVAADADRDAGRRCNSTTTPASEPNTRAIVAEATLCNSIISTECGTSAATASMTSGHTGLAPFVVSVPGGIDEPAASRSG